jgi:hypothetical protein
LVTIRGEPAQVEPVQQLYRCMSWRKRPPEDMASPQPASSRRRTFDYSHQPEQGLQEWASRIKSIQAEVDQDEQAEQKRLEEVRCVYVLAHIAADLLF